MMMTNSQQPSQLVAILGASAKPERYSYKAHKMLREYGHTTVLINPGQTVIEGEPVFDSLHEYRTSPQFRPIDTLTLYVNPETSTKLAEQILELKPGRVIFNPGSENTALQTRLQDNGIPFEIACTLVLLRTNQFTGTGQ